MKLFIDSANLKEIEDCLKKGVIQGITTNPSILSKEPKTDFIEHIKKITGLCAKYNQLIPLSVEVLKETPSEMLEEAEEFVKKINYENINIKIPLLGWEELEVIRELAKKNIKVNCTCLFSESQCLLAAYAGAKYVSLFRGRMKDIGIDANQVIRNTRYLLNEAKLDSEIIIGSIRGPSEITDSFLCGAHIVTSGPEHIKKMAFHQKSIDSANQFLNDFKQWIK
jgi:transaldolase